MEKITAADKAKPSSHTKVKSVHKNRLERDRWWIVVLYLASCCYWYGRHHVCVRVCVCVSAPTQVSSEFNRVVWYRAQVQFVHQLPACTNTDYRVVCQICTMRSAEYNTMSSTIPSCWVYNADYKFVRGKYWSFWQNLGFFQGTSWIRKVFPYKITSPHPP